MDKLQFLVLIHHNIHPYLLQNRRHAAAYAPDELDDNRRQYTSHHHRRETLSTAVQCTDTEPPGSRRETSVQAVCTTCARKGCVWVNGVLVADCKEQRDSDSEGGPHVQSCS